MRVKRLHGLGNILMLLPTLLRSYEDGDRVVLQTSACFVPFLRAACPWLQVTSDDVRQVVDLDVPFLPEPFTEYKGHYYAGLLGIMPPYKTVRETGKDYTKRIRSCRSHILVAPEAMHPARLWRFESWAKVGSFATKQTQTVAVGLNTGYTLSVTKDLRGRTSLEDLARLVVSSRLVLCLDSGVFHLSRFLGTPSVAMFSGISPRVRCEGSDYVSAIYRPISCWPCNKKEACGGEYNCIRAIPPEIVLSVLEERLAAPTMEYAEYEVQ